ncbi:MAG: hypothetical protein Q8Q04_01790, partial [archaeon]|nr:hypothetical protein [archaeon]
MKFNRGELNWINEWSSEGYDLSKILTENFSEKKIYVIQRHFTAIPGKYLPYEIYFEEKEAEDELKNLSGISKYNSIPGSYIIDFSIKNLYGKV